MGIFSKIRSLERGRIMHINIYKVVAFAVLFVLTAAIGTPIVFLKIKHPGTTTRSLSLL